MIRLILIIISTGLFLPSGLSVAAIRHLELGAANYAPSEGASVRRFHALDQTLTDLVLEYGNSGVVYLNDIDAEGLQLARKHVENWFAVSGISGVRIVSLVGDYTKIKLPQVQTANLSNPSWEQLPNPANDKTKNLKTTRELEKIASLSDTGLRISSYYYAHTEVSTFPWEKQADPNFANYMGILMSLVEDSVFIATGEPGYFYNAPGDSSTSIVETGKHIEEETQLFILISKKKVCEILLKGKRLFPERKR